MEALAPRCIVEINGTRFDSWRGENLISSSVDLTTDKTGEGSIELFDPDYKIIDSLLADGVKPLEAKFYYGWSVNPGNPLFTGSLARVEWSNQALTLSFHDKSSKMKQAKKTRYHKRKTDIQILRKLAEDNGLEFSTKSQIGESQIIDSWMQAGKTDWEFALKVASRAGLRLYVQDNTLFAVEAGTTTLNEPSAMLNFEKDFTLLRGFNLSYKLPENKKGRPHRTTVRGRGKNDRQLKGEAHAGTSGTTDIVVHEDLPQASVSLATRRATGKTSKRREYAFEHQIRTLSSFRQIIEVRKTLTLAGMGKFFSGNYVVTDIRHSFRAGDLNSEITVGRDILK